MIQILYSSTFWLNPLKFYILQPFALILSNIYSTKTIDEQLFNSLCLKVFACFFFAKVFAKVVNFFFLSSSRTPTPTYNNAYLYQLSYTHGDKSCQILVIQITYLIILG